MSKSTPPWTPARLHSFIISTLRSGMRRWPAKWNVLKASATEKKVNPKSGRMAQHYKCAKCKQEFTNKDVQVDHKQPAVDPKKGFISWDSFIARLFVDEKKLQVLCKLCHAVKTKKERKARESK